MLLFPVKPSANEHIAGLKPSTLKQLGHMITPSALQQVTLLTLHSERIMMIIHKGNNIYNSSNAK